MKVFNWITRLFKFVHTSTSVTLTDNANDKEKYKSNYLDMLENKALIDLYCSITKQGAALSIMLHTINKTKQNKDNYLSDYLRIESEWNNKNNYRKAIELRLVKNIRYIYRVLPRLHICFSQTMIKLNEYNRTKLLKENIDLKLNYAKYKSKLHEDCYNVDCTKCKYKIVNANNQKLECKKHLDLLHNVTLLELEHELISATMQRNNG